MKMSVAEWYSGRTVLVTGGTGFMGKVLLEKLLRSCPEIKRIYVLTRPKRGSCGTTRLQSIKELPLFDKLRSTTPGVFDKLVAVHGDITEEGLGLSDADRRRVTTEVSVVFNGAASLRLEAGLKAAVQHNTVPTERLLKLAKDMPLLKVFVHLSTAFCHCEEETLCEKVYPSSAYPYDIIRTAQTLDDKSLEIVTPRILGVHPNCYTYSKRLSETLVEQYGADIPVVIVRPSIVLPIMHEPCRGWVDTLNGPIGIIVGAGKGVIRTMMCGSDFSAEVVPVDIAINAIIAVAWKVGSGDKKKKEVPVYNVTQGDLVRVTWGEILEKGRKLNHEYPFDVGAWYPDGAIRTNRFVHNFMVLFFHILPAYFIDFLLTIFGQKRFMVRIQKRISTGLEVLQYFTMRDWDIRNENTLALNDSMTEEDRKTFYISTVKIDIEEYMKDVLLGARQYILKEPLDTLPKARRQMKMMYYLDRFVAATFYGFVGWFLFKALRSMVY